VAVTTPMAMAAAVLSGSAALVCGTADAALPPVRPMPPAGEFVRAVDNPYFPLRPGTTLRYQGMKDGERATDKVTVTRLRKTILGVKAIVVLDIASVAGDPEEKTYDWYAQDKHGNVWYLGEDSFDRKNGKWVRNDGSWRAGLDGAKAGIIMKANPQIGETYRQEHYVGHAEDVARILQKNQTVSVPYRRFRHVLETRDWSPLEPNVVEHKYFARGVGEVKSVMVKGGAEQMALVSVTRTPRD
jgi:hypothetical protein